MFTLIELRQAKEYELDFVAAYCGISQAEMLNLEKDQCDIPASVAIKIRKLYGIPLDYIKV